MYAIVMSGGKQYKVHPGDKIKVEKVPIEVGKEVVFDKVLLKAEVGSEGKDRVLMVGNPFIEGSIVRGKVLEQTRGKKVKILKFRRRKHSMKNMGHRQPYSEIEIESIS
jgi:large subunit ribosomal protein L21